MPSLFLPDGKTYRYPIAMFAPETQEIVRRSSRQGTSGTILPVVSISKRCLPVPRNHGRGGGFYHSAYPANGDQENHHQ